MSDPGSIVNVMNKTPIATIAKTANTRIRFSTTPAPSGCRWCGYEERSHGNVWVRSVGSHLYVNPTVAQRKARMLARRNSGAET